MYATVFADCAFEGINVWPFMGTILPNQQFIIQGYASDQQMIRELSMKYPVFLNSDQGQVALDLIEVCEGEMHLTQAILRPQSMLRPGITYHLWIQGIHDNPAISDGAKRDLDLMWRPIGFPDVTAPKWVGAPVVKRSFYEPLGCGPEIGVEFAIKTDEMKPCWVKADVRVPNGEIWTSYYLEVKSGIATIGHGMCGGAFRLSEGKDFEAKFTLVDQAGHSTPLEGDPIRFTRPAEMELE